MVNILRTLLLNLPSAPEAAGEEFIDPSFQSRILNPNQAALRQAVFPKDFDRPYLNFIATLLARLAGDSAFQDRLLALDPRTLLSDPVVNASGFASSLVVNPIKAASSVCASGVLTPDPINGVFDRTWFLNKFSDTQVGIWDIMTGMTSTATVSFDNNSSTSFALVQGSTLRVYLADVSAVPDGLQASVTATVPMSYDLLALYQRMQLAPDLRQLFFLPAVAPVSVACRAAFDDTAHPDTAVAAVLTAYAYSFQEAL